METITNGNVKDFVVNGSWSIVGSMKPDGDSKDVKKFTLNVNFANVPVVDVINKALEPTKITWVNGQGRPNFDKWSNGQTIKIDFKSPATAYVDPKDAMINEAKAAGVNVEDKNAFSDWLKERFGI